MIEEIVAVVLAVGLVGLAVYSLNRRKSKNLPHDPKTDEEPNPRDDYR